MNTPPRIDIEEFQHLLQNPKLQVWLGQLEIETTDLVGLFQMLLGSSLKTFELLAAWRFDTVSIPVELKNSF